MSSPAAEPKPRSEMIAGYGVWALAAAVALVSACDYAGGWNDGSRLATVECLVDYHTLAVDDSIFVKVPPLDPQSRRPLPYPLNDTNVWRTGTQDKILVDGHWYSHRSPLPAVLLAGWYYVWQQITGYTAREHCDQFCYWMNLVSAGLPYAVAVVCTFQLGAALRLPLARRLMLAVSLALASVALPYACQANDHVMLLGVGSALALIAAQASNRADDSAADINPNRERGRTASEGRLPATAIPRWRFGFVSGDLGTANRQDRYSWKQAAAAGALGGLAYGIDQGAGPPLLAAIGLLLAYRTRFRLSSLAVFAAAALPWLVAHHAINFALGGTLAPIGSKPEYFNWPGSPFNRQNMTGVWNHPSLADFLRYALGLLFDPRWGFFWHNLPLLLTLTGVFVVRRLRPSETPELLALGAWAAATWLLYAALSVNHSGDCCSVRWFVPLLAAGYYFLAVLIRDDARYHYGFVALTLLGVGLGACMWLAGPWHEPHWPLFGCLQLAGVAVWIGWMLWAALWRTPPSAPARRPRRKSRGRG